MIHIFLLTYFPWFTSGTVKFQLISTDLENTPTAVDDSSSATVQAVQPHHIKTDVCSESNNADDALSMQPSILIHRETISKEGSPPRTNSQPIVAAKSHHLRPANATAGRDSTQESLSSTPVNSSVGAHRLMKRSSSDGIPLPPQVRAVRTLHVADDHMHTFVSSGIIAVPFRNLRRPLSEGGHVTDLPVENLPRGLISDQDDNIYDTPQSPLSDPPETPVYSYVPSESFTLSYQESQLDKHAKPDSFHHDLPSSLLLSNGNPSVSGRRSHSPNPGMSPSDMAAKPEKIAEQRVCSDTSPQMTSITSETGQNGTPSPASENKYTNLLRSNMDPDWQTIYQSTSPCPSPSASTNSDHTDQSVSSPSPDSDYVNGDQYSHSYMRLQESTRTDSLASYQVPDRGQLRKSEDDAVQSHSGQTHQDSAEGVTEQLYVNLSNNTGFVEPD